MHTLYRKSPLFRVSHIQNCRCGATRAKINSSKILPFQDPKARRVQYHSSELRYCTRRFECEHPTFKSYLPREWLVFHNLLGQIALVKHIEDLTFHFPGLYGLCSLFQQLKSQTTTPPCLQTPITVGKIERYLEPDIVLTTNASEGGGVDWSTHFNFPFQSTRF